jgi:ketosteroid isomerase-like protein
MIMPSATDERVLALTRTWIDAELRADVNALGSLLHDDFVGVGPLGFMLPKQAWIGRHRGGELEYQSLGLSDTSVRRFGDTAIVVAAQHQEATYQGRPVPGDQFRISLVVVGGDGDPRIGGLHLSPIAPRP